LVYSGARTIYHPGSEYDQTFQDLALSQEILGGRWTLRFRDDMSFSPQATFGGLDTGGPSNYALNSLLSSIQPSLAPGQTILTGRSSRLDNTALGEVDYALNRRSSVTFTGSYGLLHFLGPGYIDSQVVSGRAGYNYSLSPRDQISVIYGYSRTSFRGIPGTIDTDMAQLAFGRKVTGRLAWQVAGGPQILRYNGFGTSATHQLSWNVNSALSYAMRRTGYSLTYSHGMTSGSGVIFGAETNNITASISHSFTRFWSGGIEGGYALNSYLHTTSTTTGRFSNWFGGLNLGRQVGRHMWFSLNYGFQEQNANGVVCQVASCGFAGLRQVVGITMRWHPMPFGVGQ
jgi:hypothetical protein